MSPIRWLRGLVHRWAAPPLAPRSSPDDIAQFLEQASRRRDMQAEDLARLRALIEEGRLIRRPDEEGSA